MAGTIPLSMTQQMDQYGDPLSGGLLYFFVAGSVSTPQNAFYDITLTSPAPNPITLDAAGRVPQFFLADGLIKIRLVDSNGVVQLSADNVQVIGASTSGGGGGAGAITDITKVFSTGNIKKHYGANALDGWVRCNGLTIGDAVSGGTERQNNDTQALFQHLWDNDPNLVVVGGRGTSAILDFGAHKKLTLPDARGVVLAGMDDMGNSAAGRLTTAYYGSSGTVLGARNGSQSNTLTTDTMPSHTHTAISTDAGHVHGERGFTAGSGTGGGTGSPGGTQSLINTDQASAFITTTVLATGNGTSHANVQPTMVVTIYIKL